MAGEQASYQWPSLPSSSKSLIENGKLQHPDGTQWIGRNTDQNSLPYSAEFFCDGILIKIRGDDHLFIVGEDYVSKVNVDPIVKLDDSKDFEEAIKLLKKHIKLGPVLLSKSRDAFNQAASNFEDCLTSVSSKALECPDRADALFQLCRSFKEHHYQLPTLLERPNSSNQYYTSTLNAAKDYFEAKASWLRPEILLNGKQVQDSEDEVVKNALQNVVHDCHQRILSHRTSGFIKKIAGIKNELIFLITLADVELFSDLEKIMTEQRFKEALTIIRGNFLMVIKGNPEETISRNRRLSNRMYYFVLKSLVGVSKKLSDILRLEEVVTYEIDKWTVVNIPKDRKESVLQESLCQQLQILVKLANHYEPGSMSVHQKMPYNFKYVKIENHLQDDVYVFRCFLDNSLNVFMSKKLQAGSVISNLTSLEIFESHISSGIFTCDVMDSLCSVTQQVLDLLGQSFTMINKTANRVAREVLQKQCRILKRGLTNIELRDCLNVFISCWELCYSALQNITSKLSADCFEQHITCIQDMLLLIVSLVLDKNENLTQMIDILKTFDAFLINLTNLDLTWYIRLEAKQCMSKLTSLKTIELVDNKWKETVYKCYIVKNDAEFTMYIDDHAIPKHYQVAILKCFLQNIIHLAQKWNNASYQQDTLSPFIASISSRFSHFREQPGYIDFETFFLGNC